MTWPQRILLVLVAALLLLFAFSGATSYEGDLWLATFNFLAAAFCLYWAFRSAP